MRSPGEVGVEKEESVATLSDIRSFLRPLGTTPITATQPECASGLSQGQTQRAHHDHRGSGQPSARDTEGMGDRDWHALLDAHDAIVRVQLNRFRGREVNTSGDGFFAMFDGPQRAIRCAMAIRDAVQALGIEVRAGLHTGECEIRGDDIGGIGVHIGARVSGLAGANDVLVSSTLRDLVIGSGLEFEERGSHALKGVPGEWRIFAVTSGRTT
jgi:class 3 adenylate cyclase